MSDDNVTHLLNDKTVGIDQLASFDSAGMPGPGVTLKEALAEVRRLSAELRQCQKRNQSKRKKIHTLRNIIRKRHGQVLALVSRIRELGGEI